MRLRIAILAAALVFMALSSAASASGLPGILTQIGRGPTFAVRPAQIVYTGDGSGILGGFSGHGPYPRFGRLAWHVWNRHEATGQGAVWIDNCEPNCAQGTFSPSAVKVHAFDVRRGHFTRLTLEFDQDGKHVIDRRGVRRYGSYYGYYIIGVASR